MHSIEQLRWLARAGDQIDATDLVREALGAVGGWGIGSHDRIVAIRRLLERQPTCGPLWWAAARLLVDSTSTAAGWDAEQELVEDPTVGELDRRLGPDPLVVVTGPTATLLSVVRRRGDVQVVVLDAADSGWSAARRFDRLGVPVAVVPVSAAGPVLSEADVALFESDFVGPAWSIAHIGTLTMAATAQALDTEVWAVAGVGRVVPGAVADDVAVASASASAPRRRLVEPPPGFDDGEDDLGARAARWSQVTGELVPHSVVTSVIRPTGPLSPDHLAPDFEPIAELRGALRPVF